jgi:putative endonuclease
LGGPFFVYILASKRNGTLYVGASQTISRGGCWTGFTRQYGVDLLVYFEAFDSVLEARAREHSMKRWRRAWKIKLIEEFKPDWDDLTGKLNS